MTFRRALVASIIFLATSTVLQLRLLSKLYLIPEFSSSFEPAVIFNPAEKNRSWARQHFREVGIDLANTTVLLLPTDGELRELVGRDPVIVGSGMSTSLSHCEAFARNVPTKKDRWIGVAGLFNSGTNLLYELLHQNCQMPGARRTKGDEWEDDEDLDMVYWQVPWGKHGIWSKGYTAKGYEHVKRQNGLAIVVTRDPYNWSLAMCRNPYILKWLDGSSSDESSVDAACPNMSTKVSAWGVHDNILEFWNLWHRKYAFEYPHPRIMIRLEDLTFRPRETVERICECAGGITAESFHHFIDSAKSMGWQKGHGPKEELTGMVKAWSKAHFRVRGGLSEDNYAIATQTLDTDLMDLFQYQHPPAR